MLLMATMAWVAAQASAAFMARAAAQIPIFKILKVTKVVITSNLAKVVSSSSNDSRVDTGAIQSS